MVSGSLYSILINVADGETKKKLQTLDHFFNFDTLLAAAGRAVHNLFVVVLGRFVFDLVVYGPKVTLESAAKMSVDEILALMTPESGNRILDVACGTANYTGLQAARGLDMTGVDISTTMLDRARDNLLQNNPLHYQQIRSIQVTIRHPQRRKIAIGHIRNQRIRIYGIAQCIPITVALIGIRIG